ncbi:Peptide chain release factor N(5)-glutamine methyltransferase [hydrothermal vent metagenome]|uniref:peptide chain release factor N(5)-glutamine methyltransferase n=1 Tax=hydrothermal vent metagenome TaxID=652676 RepID=A0A3B1AXM8_9ZZZZ
MSHHTIREALQQARHLLHTNSHLEAEILLSFTLGKPRSHLHAWPGKPLEPIQQSTFQALLTRRVQGEPIAYITGYREFWSLELQVTPDTLIPRPETELLVERALELIPQRTPFLVADLGTGSGAIAAAIASERPHCHILATDNSPAAIAIANANFENLGLTNITTKTGEWCSALSKNSHFNLIISNPPYVPDDEPHLNRGDLPREPRSALAAGPDGLNDIRCIIHQAPSHLPPGGWLLLEHGYDQAEKVQSLLKECGLQNPCTFQDMEKRDRVTGGQL